MEVSNMPVSPTALPGHRSIDSVFYGVAGVFDVFADALSRVAGAQQQHRREHCCG
jgi:hypothetical protein